MSTTEITRSLDDWRRIMAEAEAEGLTHQQVADRHQVTRGTVGAAFSRVRKAASTVQAEPEGRAKGGESSVSAGKVNGSAHFRLVPIADLHEDPANVRRHGPANRSAVRSSLVEFGQVEALVVEAGTGKVIGGNCRLDVLREMGKTHAWVAEVDLHGADATRLALALNRTAELAEWDDEGLAKVLAGLGDGAHGSGWTDEELEALLQEPAPVTPSPAGGAPKLRNLTFALTEAQKADVEAAVESARGLGGGDPTNPNARGNALARVCRDYLTAVNSEPAHG